MNKLLRKMKGYVRELSLAPIAYCLLPNHYHWLVRQDGDVRAGLLPQRVFNAYGKAYNKRYGHSGTLFEGAYKVEPVLDEGHLLHLCRYIHANPVVHGALFQLSRMGGRATRHTGGSRLCRGARSHRRCLPRLRRRLTRHPPPA
jgi:hypothetical protein